jgi:hypothetical protein
MEWKLVENVFKNLLMNKMLEKQNFKRYTNLKRHLASSLGKWTNKKSILELINILDHLWNLKLSSLNQFQWIIATALLHMTTGAVRPHLWECRKYLCNAHFQSFTIVSILATPNCHNKDEWNHNITSRTEYQLHHEWH